MEMIKVAATMTDTAGNFADVLHFRKPVEPGDLVVPPIVLASLYHLPGQPTGPHQYGRWSNPTWSALEDALSILEQAECVVLPSGMAAIAAILYSQLKRGDRILLPSDGYYTTRSFAEKFLSPLGIVIETCRTIEYGDKNLQGYRFVWVETPSNPGLDLCDISRVVSAAKLAGAQVIVDNTTMTPLGQRPLDLGANAVVSSDTKAVAGHSDVLMGHVASRDTALIAGVREWRKLSGAIPGPFETWLVHRGLETLEMRFDRMCATAGVIADRLRASPKIVSVTYPGLPEHPSHQTAKGQMKTFGSVIGVTFATKFAAEQVIANARFVRATTSFGGVHTSAERRARWGDQVAEGFVRLSIGCEPTEALWSDIESALAGV
jgi:cystathionine gamma-lyase